ncbi:hypothetical protein JCM10207_008604 [Rhodosporidiobolus poonsookiae]
MLSSLSGSISTYFHRQPIQEGAGTAADAEEEQEHALEDAEPATAIPLAPHTPIHRSNSQRLSPNSLSASGSQTMSGILSAHPHFSVFRKNASQQSIDEIVAGRSRDNSPLAGGRPSFSVRDLQDEEAVETLVTPPNQSPSSNKTAADKANVSVGSENSSFHLSLDSGDMPSLNFGDQSSLSLSPSGSPASAPPSRASSVSPSSAPTPASPSVSASTSGVRLVPDSPPTTRTPARQSLSRSTSADRSEKRKLRGSTGPVQRVQFSPLSLCPSPLINAPTLPPPPPPPPFSSSPPSTTERSSFAREGTPTEQVLAARGILKPPRTPGTGRSVRFSASTVRRTPESAGVADLSELDVSGEADEGDELEDEDEDEGGGDSPSVHPGSRSAPRAASSALTTEADASAELDGQAGTSTEEGHSSVLVASFLSKLQAAIPSPDVSLLSPPVSSSALPSLPSVPEIAIGPSTPSTQGPAKEKEEKEKESLFDESNPFWGLNSFAAGIHTGAGGPSALGASTLQFSLDVGVEGAASLPLPVIEEASVSSAASTTVALAQVQEEVSHSQLVLSGGSSVSHSHLHSQLLVDGSLASLAGAPSFGGDSFAQVSHPHRPLAVEPFPAAPGRLEEISAGEEEDASAATIAPSPARTPRRSSSPPQTPPSADHAAPASPARTDASPLHASDLSSPASSRSPSSPAARAESTLAPPSPLASSLSPSPPPAYAPSPPRPAATSAPAPAPAAQLSFYRQFMASRAQAGGSDSARREWERLERGEKGSPKDLAGSTTSVASAGARKRTVDEVEGWEEAEGEQETPRGEDVEQAASPSPTPAAFDELEHDPQDESVYYSPQKSGFGELDEYEEEVRSGIRVVSDDEEDEGGEGSVIDHGAGRGTFLSPIVEVSEPESNANTPFDPSSSTSARRPRSAAPLPPQPSFTAVLQATPAPPATPSRALTSTRAPVTPVSASKIPRPRNPITPSQNPFLLQLARPAPGQSQPSKAGQLLHDLFSAQQDQLATSSNQRFILSSLVTNLQNEVEHKDKMVENLKKQVEDARDDAREVEQLALAWEKRFRDATATSSSSAPAPPTGHERQKVAALEETIRLLADELETRVRDDRAHRHALEDDLARVQGELARTTHQVREGEIRLRHERTAREGVEEERERVREERDAAVREREEMRTRWSVEAEETARTVQRLREEVRTPQDGQRGAAPSEAQLEAEVDRRVAQAMEHARRDAALVKHELVQRDTALAALREQVHGQQGEIDRLTRAVQEERQHAELATADLAAELAAKEEQIAHLAEEQAAAQQEFDDLFERIDAAEAESARLTDTLRAEDEQLMRQTEASGSTNAALPELEAHIARLEADLAARSADVDRVQREMDQLRRDAADTLEKRDRVLGEAEKAAARAKREAEGTQKENNRLNDLVAKLRRDSADREVKVTKLKKRAAELEEDVFGLNIALDAKQQEASHWKRQLSTLKHDRDRAAASSLSLADSTTFPASVARPAFAPIPGSTVRRSATMASLSTTSKKPSLASTPQVTQKTARSRVSIARRPDPAAASASSATEETDQDLEVSQDLTLPTHDSEKTPSRAPVAAVRRSSSSASLGVAHELPKSRSSSSLGGFEQRRRTSSSEKAAAKENEPPTPAPVRRRKAVLA